MTSPADAKIEQLRARALALGTASVPESDGTLAWSSTTMVLVELHAAGAKGIGYTYAHASAVPLIQDLLAGCVVGTSAGAVGAAHARMIAAVRNQGHQGLSAAAISAVDNALWDLRARLLEVPLPQLIGQVRNEVPAYASGGFTSSDPEDLAREIADYVNQGFRQVKIKIGRHPAEDVERVRAARAALPHDLALMVDANGAYERKQALAMAERFAEFGVVWFEEPVSSDDLEGLRLLRDRAPAGMDIAAGEYGYDENYFRRMLCAGAVDVLQADATRCAGVTGFLRADALCTAFATPLSAHCAPALHCQLGAAANKLVHVECFRDHVRMEERVFEGTPALRDGNLCCDGSRPGNGLALREEEVRRHAI